MNTLSEVYLTHSAAFLPNAPVGNDEMEAVLGIVGDTPSRVRQMILRSNGIRSRHYAIDPAGLGAVRQWLDRMWDDALAAFAAEVDREDGEEERSV